MPETGNALRILVVDDDRDGADTLGMVVEELVSRGALIPATDGRVDTSQ